MSVIGRGGAMIAMSGGLVASMGMTSQAATRTAGGAEAAVPATAPIAVQPAVAFASGLIAAGCDVVTVQHALGHSTPTITLNTYSHLWPQAEDRTRAAAASLWRPLRLEVARFLLGVLARSSSSSVFEV